MLDCNVILNTSICFISARRKGGDSRPNSEEEYDTADNLSTISNLSDQGSIPEEGTSEKPMIHRPPWWPSGLQRTVCDALLERI